MTQVSMLYYKRKKTTKSLELWRANCIVAVQFPRLAVPYQTAP